MPPMEPMQPLLASGVAPYPLPEALERLHGDGFGFAGPLLYSNFVSSLDGVVALGDGRHAGSVISGRNPADRFLMGLLRACADAVLIGAGTLRATPDHLWTPEHIAPDLAAEWAELRRRLGRAKSPLLAVLSASGEIDVTHPAIQAGATVLTTRAGADRLDATGLPPACRVVVTGEDRRVEAGAAVAALRADGHRHLLTEGGPGVMGQLLDAGLLEEMFLTLSPAVAGRSGAEERPGFTAGVELMPGRTGWWRLLSVHRHRDHLFLRYARA